MSERQCVSAAPLGRIHRKLEHLLVQVVSAVLLVRIQLFLRLYALRVLRDCFKTPSVQLLVLAVPLATTSLPLVQPFAPRVRQGLIAPHLVDILFLVTARQERTLQLVRLHVQIVV